VKVFERMEAYGHEQVVFCHDKVSGLKSIIAIHDTTLGPALGGCRMWPYDSEEDALFDVLRLSRGMTYKNSVMGLNLGGGKAVIIADPRKDKSEQLWRAFGKFVQSLGGRYYTAEDVGTSPDDMSLVREETDFVAGLHETSGDPSPATAYGVFMGMKACLQEVYGTEDFTGKAVAVQGLGHVGYYLCRHLRESGADLVVTDIFEDKVQLVVDELGATAVAPDDIYGVECEIFSPNALGAVINDETIGRLKCKIVAGAANNQLKEDRHGEELKARGILYAPDYVINGGGVTNVGEEMHPAGYDKERAYRKIADIKNKLTRIFATAKEKGICTNEAADRVAEERLEIIGRIQRIRV